MPALTVEQMRTLIDRAAPRIASAFDTADVELTADGVTAFIAGSVFSIPEVTTLILLADGTRRPEDVPQPSTPLATIQASAIIFETAAALPADFDFPSEVCAALMQHSQKLALAACLTETATLN